MGEKILVVEDNELNLKLFCDLLRAHGYQAEPVRDGREAVERARAFAPHLIVMDIQMPHISGLELIEQLKADEELKATPIMAVTAYAAKGDEERIRDAGAEGYVSKPISVIRFVEAVKSLLAAPRPEADPSLGIYRCFAWAVENRTRIVCSYDGHEREICPIVLGRTDGKEVALVYQVSGGTSRGPLQEPDWKCFQLSKVGNVQLWEGEWGVGSSHQQEQSCVQDVDYDANELSPYGPKRSLGSLRGAPPPSLQQAM